MGSEVSWVDEITQGKYILKTRRGLGYNLEAYQYFKSWPEAREEDYQGR